MKLNGNAVKPGNVIAHNGRLWTAVKVAHVKPGKGGAFAQIELRDIRDGTKLNERFRSSETVERIILDETECTFLYDDGDHLVFMQSETFEQISIKKEMVGERATFLQDGMIVTMSSHEGDPWNIFSSLFATTLKENFWFTRPAGLPKCDIKTTDLALPSFKAKLIVGMAPTIR